VPAGDSISRPSTAERAELDSRRVERVYATLAGVYDAGFDWALGPGRRRAVAALSIADGHRVLEVGVGTGLSLPHYPAGCRITGIDISEPMLEQAHRRADSLGLDRVDLRLMDARELQFGDATFDHVLAPYVISVVPEPRRVMAEIARVCRPGGTVAVVNHFGSAGRWSRRFERLVTPVTQWLGFRMDLPPSVVTETAGLSVRTIERVNLCGLWRLIVLDRPA
jgi:phosphatidylethanolamine/phosphatidyl-N-methylethanolamine N-methyltransferase